MARKTTLADRIEEIVKDQTIVDDRPHMQTINGWLESCQRLYNETSDLMFNIQDTRAWMEDATRIPPKMRRNMASCTEYVDNLIGEVRKMRLANDKIRGAMELDPLTLKPNDEEEDDSDG